MTSRILQLAAKVWQGLAAYLVKFGVVGAVGWVLDVAIFNILRANESNFAPFGGFATWATSVLGAKTISTGVAILFNWIGNRYWTFREHRRKNYLRELIEYIIVSLGGMAIALICLWITHHVLGWRNPVADNISANVVGLALGTAFRFVLYRFWVYGNHRADGLNKTNRVEEAERSLFETTANRG